MRKLILNRTAYLTLTCAVLVLLASASPVKADTIYTTGGTPPTFVSSGIAIGNGGSAEAVSFVATETATLTDAILPLQILVPDPPPADGATVFIESSVAGVPTGTVLDTLTTSGTVTTSGQNLTYTCTVCSVLHSGTTYDIVVQQTAGADLMQWDNTNPAVTGFLYLSNIPSPTPAYWTAYYDGSVPAFEVDGTAVAEPSSLLLLGAGLLALAVMGRRKFAANGLAQS